MDRDEFDRFTAETTRLREDLAERAAARAAGLGESGWAAPPLPSTPSASVGPPDGVSGDAEIRAIVQQEIDRLMSELTDAIGAFGAHMKREILRELGELIKELRAEMGEKIKIIEPSGPRLVRRDSEAA